MASLYRKWRSRSFDDLVGQEHVVRTLRNAVRNHRVAHAYLFTGPRGTGKTSTARILSKAVNCLAPRDGNPCNECAMCVAANEGRAMDVIEIDAASNTSVDSVRELRERVAYAAGEGAYKVYIVDEVHRLSGAAFDAFLKTLEEPPEHVIFVFASTEPHKVPATIMSRCQRFDFHRIDTAVALDRMRQVAAEEKITISPNALGLIAQRANGSLRDALGLLDQVAAFSEGEISDDDVRAALGLADAGLVAELTDCLLDGRTGRGLEALEAFVGAGGDARQLAAQFIDYWRALLLQVLQASGQVIVDPALAPHLSRHATGLRERQVIGVLRVMAEQEFSPKFNLPPQLPFEVGYAQAALALHPEPAPRQTALVQTDSIAAQIGESALDNRLAEKLETSDDPPAGIGEPTPVAVAGQADAWKLIIEKMRPRSRMLQAVLRSGYLLRIQNGEITIGFLDKDRFHLDQFSDRTKRRLVEEAAEEVLGASCRAVFVRTSKDELAALGSAVVAEDDGFIGEVAERLRQFHVKQLQDGNSW